ncbi:uncharacterized protein VP01_939g6 [Puccinia sorghi]|uniref:Uncharacterized protein n=1 Tax=Puccinia sorghi TaxID=27349 RepID=A0A0L6U6T4_9BASI|nr:uncharacterized protein VP01_939g6 [Puccinia sorghi]
MFDEPSASGNSNTSHPSSVDGSSTDSLLAYFEFFRISNIKCQAISNMLISKNIDKFHIFDSLTYEELQVLGFNFRIISKICANFTT